MDLGGFCFEGVYSHQLHDDDNDGVPHLGYYLGYPCDGPTPSSSLMLLDELQDPTSPSGTSSVRGSSTSGSSAPNSPVLAPMDELWWPAADARPEPSAHRPHQHQPHNHGHDMSQHLMSLALDDADHDRIGHHHHNYHHHYGTGGGGNSSLATDLATHSGTFGTDAGPLELALEAGVGSMGLGGASLGLSFFDLQAGSLESLGDAVGSSLSFYGMGHLLASSQASLPKPSPTSTVPSSGLGPVKAERNYHHRRHQQPHSVADDEPLLRKRKLAASGRRGTSEPISSMTASPLHGCKQDKGVAPLETPKCTSKPKPKSETMCDLTLMTNIESLLGTPVKQEPQAECGKPLYRVDPSRHNTDNACFDFVRRSTSADSRASSGPVELVIERQPPVEVRTRTPSENRNFGVTVRVIGSYDSSLHSIDVRLVYASSSDEVVRSDHLFQLNAYYLISDLFYHQNQQILGGRKVVPIQEDGRATFDSLSMREASTKHGEREFCLEFVPITKEGQVLGNFGTRTNPFYAYSHMKVLARRKSVKLRTLNKSHGSIHGGDKMHVIGQPFIKGPSLSIIFSTPHGDVTVSNPELYSDSVLFFEAPPYPCPAIFSPYNRDPVREITVKVQVTNDGRTMSNPLEFTYVADKYVHRADF